MGLHTISGFSMANAADAVAAPASAAPSANDDDFRAVMSAINPLQFLPGVGTIYRAVTGDEGSPGLRAVVALASGALLGGPFGLLTSAAGVLAFQVLHLDRMALAALHDAAPAEGAPAAPDTAVAAASTRDRAASRLAAAAGAAYGRSLALAGQPPGSDTQHAGATAATGRG